MIDFYAKSLLKCFPPTHEPGFLLITASKDKLRPSTSWQMLACFSGTTATHFSWRPREPVGNLTLLHSFNLIMTIQSTSDFEGTGFCDAYAGAEVEKVGGGATEFRYPSYVQHIMGWGYFSSTLSHLSALYCQSARLHWLASAQLALVWLFLHWLNSYNEPVDGVNTVQWDMIVINSFYFSQHCFATYQEICEWSITWQNTVLAADCATSSD